jgi:hypothetical protein
MLALPVPMTRHGECCLTCCRIHSFLLSPYCTPQAHTKAPVLSFPELNGALLHDMVLAAGLRELKVDTCTGVGLHCCAAGSRLALLISPWGVCVRPGLWIPASLHGFFSRISVFSRCPSAFLLTACGSCIFSNCLGWMAVGLLG